jgi:hypothetical protein
MSKPLCKAEASWKFWRDDGRYMHIGSGFSAQAKKLMRKARRKFLRNSLKKQITNEETNV